MDVKRGNMVWRQKQIVVKRYRLALAGVVGRTACSHCGDGGASWCARGGGDQGRAGQAQARLGVGIAL
jgi:hypothetical protein